MLYLIPLWKRIEVVITSRTRNAVVLTGTWVRIPPLPPRKEELFALCYRCRSSFTTLFTTNITACWSHCSFVIFASTFIDFKPEKGPFQGENLKHSQYKRNCCNRIAELLKQLLFAKDIFNNWKNLGDKTGVLEDLFEAIFGFLWLLQNWQLLYHIIYNKHHGMLKLMQFCHICFNIHWF